MVCELWSVWTLSNISPTETFRQSSESLCQESFLSFFFLLSSCQRNLHLNQEAQRCTETSTTRSELQSLSSSSSSGSAVLNLWPWTQLLYWSKIFGPLFHKLSQCSERDVSVVTVPRPSTSIVLLTDTESLLWSNNLCLLLQSRKYYFLSEEANEKADLNQRCQDLEHQVGLFYRTFSLIFLIMFLLYDLIQKHVVGNDSVTERCIYRQQRAHMFH